MTKRKEGSIRDIASKTGISPTTVLRALRGDTIDIETAKALLPWFTFCPCCGKVNSFKD